MAVLERVTPLRRWLDACLAVALLAVGESQIWGAWNDGGVGSLPHGHRLARAVLLVGFVAPLAWRRRHPLASVAMTCAAIVVQLAVVTAYVPFLTGLLPMAIGNYTAAAYALRWRGVGFIAAFAAEAVIYARIPEERTGGEVLFAIFVLLGTWAAGDVVRNRLARAEQSVQEARLTAVEMEAAAAQALVEERARIARELHDMIAHSVSVMGVQAGAARTLIESDPDAARDALHAVEATARTSVAELQRLLAVLRDRDSPVDDRAPQPGLDQLPALAERMHAAGLSVQLTLKVRDPVPGGVGLAVYRIVQEALTNTLKHSNNAARATVTVEQCSAQLRIEVRDTGSAPSLPTTGNPGGHGLVGMQERAALYGGTMHAGPAPDGGFVVHACLPLTVGGAG